MELVLNPSSPNTQSISIQNSNNAFLDTKLNSIVLNVIDYGAKNDNSTDNSSAFSSISNYVNNTEGNFSIFFPDGKYVYKYGLIFTKPVKLFSNGGAELVYTGTGKAIFFTSIYNGNGTPTNGYFQHDTVENITFRNGQNMTQG